MRGGRFLGVLVASSFALALGACGDDDSGDDAADVPAETTGGDAPSADDIDDLAAFVDDDCEFLLAGAFMNPAIALTPGSDFDFEEYQARFEALAEEAPGEVEDDLDTIADRMGRMRDALGDVDLSSPSAYADPEVQAAFGELEEIFDDEYQAATQNVSAYVAEHCSDAGPG